ncbi:hypothetical protein VCHA34P129_120089 [Vibrio chagasii]|nr:hypothetical protein VCHA34P129_120089 [Vibrio chagasii]CAH6916277.1 hypothetical protein VCHA40P242_130055 [Vibrio chagasii]CAH6980723.1 hypothetical protein VCHA52P455_150052 [Vibrio chagasii]
MTLCRKKLSVCLFFARTESVILIYINHKFKFIYAIALLLSG